MSLTPLEITLDLVYGQKLISKLLFGGDVGTYKIPLILVTRNTELNNWPCFWNDT
jgi:hypothetical protein